MTWWIQQNSGRREGVMLATELMAYENYVRCTIWLVTPAGPEGTGGECLISMQFVAFTLPKDPGHTDRYVQLRMSDGASTRCISLPASWLEVHLGLGWHQLPPCC